MGGFNLPPGCSVNDIPGNRPEDLAWEKMHEEIDDECVKENLSDQDAWFAWKLGVAALKTLRAHGIKLPHE